jgi:hypothetical protein
MKRITCTFVMVLLLATGVFMILTRLYAHKLTDTFTSDPVVSEVSQKITNDRDVFNSSSTNRDSDSGRGRDRNREDCRAKVKYRNRNQFDNIFADKISKHSNTRSPLSFNTNVNVRGSLNAQQLNVNTQPFVSYNKKTRTFEFL